MLYAQVGRGTLPFWWRPWRCRRWRTQTASVAPCGQPPPMAWAWCARDNILYIKIKIYGSVYIIAYIIIYMLAAAADDMHMICCPQMTVYLSAVNPRTLSPLILWHIWGARSWRVPERHNAQCFCAMTWCTVVLRWPRHKPPSVSPSSRQA